MARISQLVWLVGVAACARGSLPYEGRDAEPLFDSGVPVDIGDDAPCSGRDASACDPDTRASIYLARDGQDGRRGTSPAEAVGSLAVALELAAGCPGGPCNVRIAEGTYEGSAALIGGVDLLGGYGPSFTSRDPAAHPVVLTSRENRTVIAEGLTGPVLLDGLTIKGAQIDTNDGRSSYALWVSASEAFLSLTRVTIAAGAGAAGAKGADGALTDCTPQPGLGGAASDCDAASGIAGGAGNDPVQGGQGGPGGGSNCPSACPLIGRDGISDGQPGTQGEPGSPGERGLAATDVRGKFLRGEWKATEGAPGGRGRHGTGGGGGGAGGSKRIRACFGCDTIVGGHGGNGGAGGCGGGGGAQGGPGGGAFALAVLDSTVTLDGVVLQGGAGGPGGSGGTGAEGSPGDPPDDSVRTDGVTQRCGAIDYNSGHGGGGAGGGSGGAGGGGAGGSGGPAITLVLVGAGEVVRSGDVSVTPGAAGAGGPGGTSSGAPGESGKPGLVTAEASY